MLINFLAFLNFLFPSYPTALPCQERLVAPANGRMKCSGFTTNETCTFVCDPGYDERGSTLRVCLPTAKWSGSIFVCQGTFAKKLRSTYTLPISSFCFFYSLTDRAANFEHFRNPSFGTCQKPSEITEKYFKSLRGCSNFTVIFGNQYNTRVSDVVFYPDNRSFPWHAKNEEKKKLLKKSCQNPVERDAI